jgi:hypothetical protein
MSRRRNENPYWWVEEDIRGISTAVDSLRAPECDLAFSLQKGRDVNITPARGQYDLKYDVARSLQYLEGKPKGVSDGISFDCQRGRDGKDNRSAIGQDRPGMYNPFGAAQKGGGVMSFEKQLGRNGGDSKGRRGDAANSYGEAFGTSRNATTATTTASRGGSSHHKATSAQPHPPMSTTATPAVKRKKNKNLDYPRFYTRDTEKVCVLCQEPLSTGPKRKLKCGHVHHAACLKEWKQCMSFGIERDCPSCSPSIPFDRAASARGVPTDKAVDQAISSLLKFKETGNGGEALRLLRLYVKNLVVSEGAAKYRSINLESNAFKSKGAPLKGACVALLVAIGFEKRGTSLDLELDAVDIPLFKRTLTKVETGLAKHQGYISVDEWRKERVPAPDKPPNIYCIRNGGGRQQKRA